MRIAVLSDIHGNLPALETILADIDAWQPDKVIVNGDVVNRGPKPRECWQLIDTRIREQGWIMTRGNHEEFVVEWDTPRVKLGSAEADLFQSSLWTYHQLPASAIAYFKTLPIGHSETLFDTTIRFNHASPHGTRDGIGPWNNDDEVRRKIAPAPDLFFTAHTHRLFVRQIDQTQVINSGSVGVPLDNDKRANYARLSWQDQWQIELIRLDYDRAQTQRDFNEVNYCEECGVSSALLYLEWRDAQSYVPDFFRTYGQAIREGTLTVAKAVATFLDSQGLTIEQC